MIEVALEQLHIFSGSHLRRSHLRSSSQNCSLKKYLENYTIKEHLSLIVPFSNIKQCKYNRSFPPLGLFKSFEAVFINNVIINMFDGKTKYLDVNGFDKMIENRSVGL